MPPATFRTVNVDSIKISDRMRKDVGDISKLSDSIKQFGLFSPVLLDENLELVAGFRRLSAMRALGWTDIPYVNFGDLTELQRREIELEENIQRKQMHFMEEQRAIVEIDRLRQVLTPGWNQAQTAALIGKPGRGPALVSEAKLLVDGAELFPEVLQAKSKNQALSWLRARAVTVNRTLDVRAAQAAGDSNITEMSTKVVLGDSVEVIKSIPAETFDAIITDPPFGLDYDERKAGTESGLTTYEDSEESYERLLGMADDLYRVLKPNGWLVWFQGMSWYGDSIGDPPEGGYLEDFIKWKASYRPGTKTVFRRAGFTVDELPIIWDRSDGRCHTNRPDRYFTRAYDAALHCFKGEPEIVQRGKPNIIRVAPVGVEDRHATVERPPDLYAELIRRLTVKGEIVADFFVGSGACLLAAQSLGRDFFGVELDPDRHALAVTRLSANAKRG